MTGTHESQVNGSSTEQPPLSNGITELPTDSRDKRETSNAPLANTKYIKLGQAVIVNKNSQMNSSIVTTSPVTPVSMPTGVQLVNVRPAQNVQMSQTRGINPRQVVVNQISGVRAGQGQQQLTLQSLQGIPAGNGTLLVRTENGQYQVLRVSQIPANGNVPSNVVVQNPNNTFRLGQINQTASNSVPISGTSSQIASGSQVIVTATSTSLSNTSVAFSNATQTTPQATVGQQTITAESAKTKCKNFLSTLLRLAGEQRQKVAQNVCNLIQGLIDGDVQPELFTEALQKDLNSTPQPCLVPFLKKTLPYLRTSLAKGEITIDGVRAPPLSAVQPVTGHTTVIPSMNIVRTPTTPSNVKIVNAVNANNRTQVTPQTANNRVLNIIGGKLVPSKIVSNLTNNNQLNSYKPVTRASIKDDKKQKDKGIYNSYSTSTVGDDDINDVAAMGGVNLGEESQRILDSTGFVGTQIRSCKDEVFLSSNALSQRIRHICSENGIEEASKDAVALVSHAAQERMKYILQKLALMAEHRLDLIKNEPKYELTQDVKGQVRFIEDLDKMEKKKKDEQERELLMRAAKSRNRTEDPEQAKLKQKAKEMQRAEMEEMRQRDANLTAMQALQGPKKRQKLDNEENATFSGTFTQKSMPLRPRIKRVCVRDMMYLMEQERDLNKSHLLYRSYLK